MKNIKIIYNPSSGIQLHQEKIFVIARKLVENGNYRVSLFATQKKDDAYEEAIKACKENFDLLIVCGGDGTVNEVINGIMDSGEKIKLAILAAGSVNDFSEHLHLPNEISKFYEMIVQEKSMPVDIGKVNQKYFINVVAGGAFTNIAHEVPSDTKTLLGRFAYYLQGAMELPYQLDKSFPISIKIDNEEPLNIDAFLFLISNSPSVGGFKKLVPEANIQDHLLDLLIIKKTTRKEMIEIFSKILTGQHIKHPAIIYRKAKEIYLLNSSNEIALDIDGEKGELTPALFKIIPRAIELIIP